MINNKYCLIFLGDVDINYDDDDYY